MKFIAWYSASAATRPPLVVIDLGYSEANQSCGVWYDGATVKNSCQFYLAVELAAQQLNAVLDRDMRPLLVVEAPLSRAHNAKGNPTARGSFENERRRWYVQPGAIVTLGVIRLLEALCQKLDDDVWIAEAFLSNKSNEDKSTRHWRDAMQIHAEFWNAPPIIPAASEICPLCGLVAGVPEVRVFAAKT